MKKELRVLMREQGMEELMMTQEELKVHEARKKLAKPMKEYIRKFRNRMKRHSMAVRIQRVWRMYKQREYSYIKGLELEKYPVLYYLKEQRIRFADIIA